MRRTGVRPTHYTGLAKNHLGNVLAATAINIIRLAARLDEIPIGKTRTTHLTALHLTP